MGPFVSVPDGDFASRIARRSRTTAFPLAVGGREGPQAQDQDLVVGDQPFPFDRPPDDLGHFDPRGGLARLDGGALRLDGFGQRHLVDRHDPRVVEDDPGQDPLVELAARHRGVEPFADVFVFGRVGDPRRVVEGPVGMPGQVGGDLPGLLHRQMRHPPRSGDDPGSLHDAHGPPVQRERARRDRPSRRWPSPGERRGEAANTTSRASPDRPSPGIGRGTRSGRLRRSRRLRPRPGRGRGREIPERCS